MYLVEAREFLDYMYINNMLYGVVFQLFILIGINT